MAVLGKLFRNANTNCFNPNSQGKSKRTCLLQLLIFFGILSFVIIFPNSIFSQSQDSLLHKLDSHYYYPSQLGLKKITAKVQWLQKDLKSSRPKFVSHPEVIFYWDVQSRERIFQVDPKLQGISETQREEIRNFFLNYREVILPRRLTQTLSGFKLNRMKETSLQTIAEYQSPDMNDEIQKYNVEVDSKLWRISKINIKRKSPPYRVVSHFKYIQKEGRWLTSETLAEFDLGKHSYSERTTYSYQNTSGFWLPVKIDQTFKKGRENIHSYQFLINQYQIN